jgi:hypothetical protein
LWCEYQWWEPERGERRARSPKKTFARDHKSLGFLLFTHTPQQQQMAAMISQAQSFFGGGAGFGLTPSTGVINPNGTFTAFAASTLFLEQQIQAPIQAAAVLLAVMCVKVRKKVRCACKTP